MKEDTISVQILEKDPVIIDKIDNILADHGFEVNAVDGSKMAAHYPAATDRQLINGMNESVWVLSTNGTILDVNNSAEKQLGYSKEELIHIGLSGIDKHLQKDPGKFTDKPWNNCFEIIVFETIHITKEGKEIPIEVSSSSIIYNGKDAILSIARDITKRKISENKLRKRLAQDELILKAVHHRIKNNISTISSMLSIQALRTNNKEAQIALSTALSRVNCIKILYDKLLETEEYQGISLANFLEGIIRSLFEIYPEKKHVSLIMDIEDIFVDEKLLFALGVIVEELFTNIFKYSFPDDKSDEQIEFSGRKSGNEIILQIKDNGQRFPESFSLETNKGFGMMIVKLLCEQIHAEFSLNTEKKTIREIRIQNIE